MTEPYRSWRSHLEDAVRAMTDDDLCHRCYVAIREYRLLRRWERHLDRETAQGDRLLEEGRICAEESRREGRREGIWHEAFLKWESEKERL